MGFLDSLLSKSTKKIVSDLTKAAIDAVASAVDADSTSQVSKPASGQAVQTVAETVPAGYEGLVDEEVDTKLEAILSKEFPQYELRTQVSPETIGGTGRFMPYSYGIYENDKPKLFIMIVSNNTCASRYYRWSKEAAGKAGIPMINFVYTFSNKIPYMIDRLHQYL